MATPVPPPSPPHLRLLRLLLSGFILGAALRGTAAGRPDAAVCPGSLDCALRRRTRCPPGAHVCGPCLQPFQEDQQGLCVPRTRRPPGGGSLQARLEDEIDILAQELARQEAGHTFQDQPQAAAPQSLEPAVLGLSERGQGQGLGLPFLRGAPSPSPHTSLGVPVSEGPVHVSPLEPHSRRGDGLILVLIVACSLAGMTALTMAALCWCRLQREIHLSRKTDYSQKGPCSPAAPRISPGDQRLAHSAEMYHYQHQRQQMLCLERHKEPPKDLDSAPSDEENEDGDFTVYECPGLAPTGEMEVRNPLFHDSALPAPPLVSCSPPPLQ
ncbi:PREDICTED: neural proliferation differentiation and control protein 1 [Elephantulus edwardii]|uniref:neural proliferation differentiation and control protein 1 n=1 Tax=Elephantulus edwardii TaxID=28737 RepID=UPI0003F05E9E|nr:PREDICTED: neural proliferation differentiation and control protein 1 [Elephantulus edwardii]